MKIIEKYKNIETCYLFDTWIKWENVTIFSWVHWDEISWVKANNKLLANILSWNISLKKWKLFLVLEANWNAVKLWKRQEKFNLNRLFSDALVYWDSYEEKRVQELKSVLKESDYFLDLHSTSWPTEAYFFCEKEFIEFWKSLNAPYLVYWWNDLDSDSNWISWDSENYVNKNWWIWLTFESGSHLSVDWEKNAYQISLNFLSKLWLIDNSFFVSFTTETKVIKIKSVYVCKTWNFKFELNNLDNFSFVWKNSIIGFDWDEKIIAENDMILVMPNLAKPWIWVDVFFEWEIINK